MATIYENDPKGKDKLHESCLFYVAAKSRSQHFLEVRSYPEEVTKADLKEAVKRQRMRDVCKLEYRRLSDR